VNTAGVVPVNCALGDYFTHTTTANITSMTFSNLPPVGKSYSLIFKITQGATPRTWAWPASFKWSGTAPAISNVAGAVDLLGITTFDQGTTWQASLAKGFA